MKKIKIRKANKKDREYFSSSTFHDDFNRIFEFINKFDGRISVGKDGSYRLFLKRLNQFVQDGFYTFVIETQNGQMYVFQNTLKVNVSRVIKRVDLKFAEGLSKIESKAIVYIGTINNCPKFEIGKCSVSLYLWHYHKKTSNLILDQVEYHNIKGAITFDGKVHVVKKTKGNVLKILSDILEKDFNGGKYPVFVVNDEVEFLKWLKNIEFNSDSSKKENIEKPNQITAIAQDMEKIIKSQILKTVSEKWEEEKLNILDTIHPLLFQYYNALIVNRITNSIGLGTIVSTIKKIFMEEMEWVKRDVSKTDINGIRKRTYKSIITDEKVVDSRKLHEFCIKNELEYDELAEFIETDNDWFLLNDAIQYLTVEGYIDSKEREYIEINDAVDLTAVVIEKMRYISENI